jgi:hypothetical protein
MEEDRKKKKIFLGIFQFKGWFKGVDLHRSLRNRKTQIWWPIFRFYGFYGHC